MEQDVKDLTDDELTDKTEEVSYKIYQTVDSFTGYFSTLDILMTELHDRGLIDEQTYNDAIQASKMVREAILNLNVDAEEVFGSEEKAS